MSQLLAGSYLGRLLDAGLGAVGKNDTPAFLLTFSLTHVAANGQWIDMAPVTRDVQLYMTENAKAYAFADLKELGFNGDFAAPKFADDLYQGLAIEVFLETYEGKTQEKLKIERLKRTRERKPVTADLARQLQAQFRQAAQNSAAPSTPPPRPPAPAAAAAPVLPGRSAAANDEPPF